MQRSIRPRCIVLVLLLSLLVSSPTAARPATPSLRDDAPTGVLAQVRVDNLPSAYLDTRSTPATELPPAAEVWFLRITLDPDGLLPMGLQIGPTVIVVESGTMTLVTDRTVEVTGSGAEPVVGDDGMHITLVEAGQSAYVREDTRLQVRNETGAEATMLELLTFSPYREVEEMEAAESAGSTQEPRGIARQQPLGVTAAEFPEGPGIITIQRVSLEAGVSESADVPAGAIVGGVEQGDVSVFADSGMCYLWPGMMEQPTEGEAATTPAAVQAPQREEIAAGETAELATGDAYGCHNGAFAWTAGDQGATIIRASVVPTGGESATPAG